jgi:hypothetical protein
VLDLGYYNPKCHPKRQSRKSRRVRPPLRGSSVLKARTPVSHPSMKRRINSKGSAPKLIRSIMKRRNLKRGKKEGRREGRARRRGTPMPRKRIRVNSMTLTLKRESQKASRKRRKKAGKVDTH